MSEEEYFKDLEEIIVAPIYLTTRTDEVQKEIAANFWSIGIDSTLASSVEISSFLTFLNEIKANRIAQLHQSHLDINLIFYLWYDEQAGNLRFNFINSNHSKLPFSSEIEIITSEEIIIREFLNSNYLEGIPWEELVRTNSEDIEETLSIFKAKVYSHQLVK